MSESTQTLSNKTIGKTLTIQEHIGDGSTVAFTVTDGLTVENVLVFLMVFQRPTTDYGVSGTTLTFKHASCVGRGNND